MSLQRSGFIVKLLAVCALALALAAALSGCGASGQENRTVTVLAASSLTDAFGEMEEVFEERYPGVEVRISYASSSALLTQLRQGAPADVYASADPQKMQRAREDGLVAAPGTFARNREEVLVPESNPADIQSFRDLADSGVDLVLAQEGVPAAEYADEILRRAADDEGYGPEFRESVLENVVSREPDVRAAVNRVVLGEADAAFAYASDVTPGVRDEVEVVEVPAHLNVTAEYPVAVTQGSENEELAREWVELVQGERGQEIMRKWGFETR